MNSSLLKSKRILVGLTQRKIAKKLGISEKSYNHKEQGKSDFKLQEVKSISKKINLSMEEVNNIFFDGDLPKV
ncbi:MAG: helix-turn-helix transcriptional regulator [Inconstantimicrobium porci]|uniref:helix-turn-helix transcriptional regulator n=1 Tax=Inconstantimicrobium porci TaxID=2652291 RepID=UPI002A90ABCB|nr:helix-turn-helix transcriptional regulator [Inconstantimicrobium porci]MDY5912430.1 helix-turn-helix transcriptional regulator [Inconstantimicrobium porci]